MLGLNPMSDPLTTASITAALLAGGLVLPDNKFSLTGSSDATKIGRFELDANTTGTTRVYSLPDATTMLAGLAVTQTFTAIQTFSSATASTSVSTGAVVLSNGGLGVAGSIYSTGLNLKDTASSSLTFTVNGSATGSPQMRFEQNSVFRGAFGYDHSVTSLYLNQFGNATRGLVVDSSNNVKVMDAFSVVGKSILGATALDGNVTSNFGVPYLAVVGDNNLANTIVNIGIGNNTAAPSFHGAKTRSTGTDAATIVQNGDGLLHVSAFGADGAAYRIAASIRMEVDGTPGLADMPGRIVFLTTPDGTTSPVECMRLNNAGKLFIGTTSDLSGIGCKAITLSTAVTYGDHRRVAEFADSTALAAGVGGGISFVGKYTAAGAYTEFGSIKGVKANATDGNTEGYLSFVPSRNAANGQEKLRIDATTTATQTALLVWDVDNAALERVTVGAADSGGAGFKLLRIPN